MIQQARHQDLYPDVELVFAICFAGRLAYELESARIKPNRLGPVRLRNPPSIWRARRRLRDLLAQKRPDVVISHSSWEQAIFGPVVKAAGLPMVFWLHDATMGDHWLERLARTVQPDLVLCNSFYTMSHLKNLYPQVRAEVVYNPLVTSIARFESDEVMSLREQLQTPREAVVITQFGRLEEWKGHALCLRALSLLADLPNWVCWQVGGAQRPHERRYLESLKRTATKLGLGDRVLFLGQRGDIPQILAATDIHCQPNTRAEPFGNVFVEALFAGVPCVTTGIGGPREILDETCGVLVPEGDLQALVAALRELIQDPVRRQTLGAAGPKRAKSLCDVETQMRRLKRVLAGGIIRKLAA
jgi:glycosyltransferase involved in cell wall biosynthesis